MTQYIQFTTTHGGTILVEVEEEEIALPEGVVKAGLGQMVQNAVAQAQTTFEEALETVKNNAQSFIQTVHSLDLQPDEVEITFGLKATGEVGNFAVAKAGGEANYTVKFTWKKEVNKKQDEH